MKHLFTCCGITLAALCMSTTAEASATTDFAAQRRLERMRTAPTVQTPATVQTPISAQRSYRITTRRTASSNLTTQERYTLRLIERLRERRNVPGLIHSDGLRTVAEKQLVNPNSTYTKEELAADLNAHFTFPEELVDEECNCSGTNEVYRQVKLRFVSPTQVSAQLAQQSGLLTNDVEYIGIRTIDNELNILLAGREVVPEVPFNTNQIRQYRAEIILQVNTERARAGLAPLKASAKLEDSAQKYAERMWNEKFYNHTAPDGGTLQDRIEDEGYFEFDLSHCNCQGVGFAVGENIAKGQETATEVMQDWMNSPGHRKNILSEEFTEIGIGIYGNRWVQHFGAVITY